MLDKNRMTLICPDSDLATQAIIKLAKAIGINDIRVSKQQWPRVLEQDASLLHALKPTVLIIEIPSVNLERQLRQQGYQLVVIDHYYYERLDRFHPRSSLEQFADWLFIDLSQTQYQEYYLMAAYSRDFLYALHELGLNYMTAMQFCETAWHANKLTKLAQRAKRLLQTNHRTIHNLHTLVVSIEYQPVMGDIAQLPSQKIYEKSASTLELFACLIVYHDAEDSARICAVELRGSRYWLQAIKAIVSDTLWQSVFYMRYVAGRRHCVFYVQGGVSTVLWNQLITQLFEFCLVEDRPARSFKTTLLFPFALHEKEQVEACKGVPKVKPWYPQVFDVESCLYFLPHIRQLLFQTKEAQSTNPRPVKCYKKAIADLTINLAWTKQTIELQVSDVSLYEFPNNNLYCLGFSVTLPDMALIDWTAMTEPLDLLYAIQRDIALWKTMQHCLASRLLVINFLVRVVYPFYREQLQEDNIAKIRLLKQGQEVAALKDSLPEQVVADDLKPRLSPVVQYLINELLDTQNKNIDPMLNDRMFVHTHISLWGEMPKTEAGKQCYKAFCSLVLYVNKTGFEHLQGFAYDPTFIQEKMEPAVLWRRYQDSGNFYGFTETSNAYIAFGDFFAKVGSRHVHSIYLYMSLLSLYYRISMLDYARRLSVRTGSLLHAKPFNQRKDNIRNLRQSFVEFTNQYWYSEITSQVQGREIFARQCWAMRLEQEYKELKEELERADEFIQMDLQNELNSRSARVTGVAAIFALIALLFAWVGIEIDSVKAMLGLWVDVTQLNIGLYLFYGGMSCLSLGFLGALWLVWWPKGQG